jgi:hypothetical protein
LEAINAASALDDPDSSVDSNLLPRLLSRPLAAQHSGCHIAYVFY